jgi:sugar phosphate isomerase/epimerase
MNRKIHAHIPYLRLFENLEYILRERINPEVYFSCDALDSFTNERLQSAARLLQAAGLSTTIHAAFLDLNPGALDATIREATRRRFQQIFQAAEILKPRVIVFHPGFDELRYGSSRAAWLENSINFWREFLPRAKAIGTVIAVENIFEKEPSTLRELMEAIGDPCFRHCFDVGHWNMFTTVGMEEWFTELGPFMTELHLHDNNGRADEHLPIGEGQIDFDLFFSLVKRCAPDAVWTIEAHTIERLERAFTNIAKYL